MFANVSLCIPQSLVIPEKFQHILRISNTNIDGVLKVPIAMTAIKGVGRRYANVSDYLFLVLRPPN